jgi:hypothetical protein
MIRSTYRPPVKETTPTPPVATPQPSLWQRHLPTAYRVIVALLLAYIAYRV